MKPETILCVLFILHTRQLAEGSPLINFIDEKVSIIINNLANLIAKCTTDVEASNVQYWLYTREEAEQLTENNMTDAIDPNKRVIFLLHGYLGNKESDYMVTLKDAYIKRYNNVNVIIPDYGFYVNSDYPSARCNLPYVGKNIARFICQLESNTSDIHIVGQSLGGQLAGLVGLYVQNTCGKIGRITGLDPAGPLYQNIHEDDRLDKTDATFVDVIHTNRGQYGYDGNSGHVDFYVNKGILQPRCDNILDGINVATIFSVIREYTICNHQSAAFYFAESISLNSFSARSAIWCSIYCIQDPINADLVYMGEYLKLPPKSEVYEVTTNKITPYGKGPNGPIEYEKTIVGN